jgi:hypothetical protein
MTAHAYMPLRHMPPEPWGRRLSRAREDLADLNLDQAAALAGFWMRTTRSTVQRLETLQAVPTGPKSGSKRQLAYVLCLAYRVDPADFDLSPDDLPPGIKIRPRRTAASTIWYRDATAASLMVAA